MLENKVHSLLADIPNPAPVAAKNVTSCDPFILQNIANRSVARFNVIDPCVTVSGMLLQKAI
jgi:hypothetical protein